VQQLFRGDKVKIEMKDGKKLTGAKSRATGAELYIERKGKTVELKRGDMLVFSATPAGGLAGRAMAKGKRVLIYPTR
jgi:hypothetical protein